MNEKQKRETFVHPFEPVFDANSKILILGSFPSVKSREISFYYGHPQNRFWRVLAEIFSSECPQNIEDKRRFLLQFNIALWDVLAKCSIEGSADLSIRDAVANDLSVITDKCDIRAIFTNGKTTLKLYNRLQKSPAQIPVTALPSTSPANASYSMSQLVSAWSIIRG